MGAMLLAGCHKTPAPSTDDQRSPTPSVKENKGNPPDSGGQPERMVVSGWAIENPTVTPRDGDYQDKGIEIRETPTTSHPFTIPKAGDRLVVFECKLTAAIEDAKALDTFSARRKTVFGMGDDTFRFLSGDGSLTPEHRKKLTGKYRVFDMERVVLTDAAGKSSKPLWCIAPEAEFTFIFTPSGKDEYLEKWMTRNAEQLPAAGRLAARTNASRFLKTDGLFVSLMELNQPASLSVLYEIPRTIPMENLKVVVEGGMPVAVKAKR
jgi:hypothetical protein